STATPRVLGTGLAATRLEWAMGYNFSSGEVRYMRVECSDTLAFDPASTIALGDPAAAVAGAINGLGSNVLTFSITSIGGPANNVAASDTLAVVGDHAITGTDGNIDCEVALYDLPSTAQAGGPTGRIASSRSAGTYLE